MSRITAVIGKNFGDEGKGLATDYLCSQSENSLVIKHNGGAQAGHTVDRPEGRFVFHQLSSGSFRHADTFWAKTYFPDIYKIGEEVTAFKNMSGFSPDIYCDRTGFGVLIDDVVINMIMETLRENDRHGSCGMGINESYVRTEKGYGITVGEIIDNSAEHLAVRLKELRKEYYIKRLSDCMGEVLNGNAKLPGHVLEMKELLFLDKVVENAAETMKRNSEMVKIIDDSAAFVSDYSNVIFESGQGLLLDMDCEKYAPHLTTSKTGLHNPLLLLKEWNLKLTEAIYVSRTYVTRHGNGPLPFECSKADINPDIIDITNIPNEWQGTIRYAKHKSIDSFTEPVISDMLNCNAACSLMLTHLNETDNNVIFSDINMPLWAFSSNLKIMSTFNKIYASNTLYSTDIVCI